MNVKELKSLLNEFDDDTPIYLSKDGEGNGFSELGAWSNASIVDDDEDHMVDFSDMAEREYYNTQLGWSFEEMDELPIVLVLWP